MSDQLKRSNLEEKKSVKQKIIEATKGILVSSSIHGIPNIVEAKFLTLRLIWGACLLASIGVCGWYLFQAISGYLDREVVTKYQVNNVNKLPFPIVSICDLKSFFDQQENKGINLESIKNALYLEKDLNLTNDFESYQDPGYGNCLRFNSGKNMKGNSVQPKYVNDQGWLNSLHLYLDPSVNPVIWISNETVDSIQNDGTLLTDSPYYYLKIQKYTIVKQPQPYSSCLDKLTSADSYPSDCYAKALKSHNTKYHYANCIKMCKQKYLGETCGFQTDLYGPAYFTDMNYLDYNTIYYDSANDAKECFSSSSSISSDYLAQCDCPLECQKDGYNIDISSSSFGKFKEIIVFYDEMAETVISEDPKTLFTDLVANLGGIFGLFTGASFLSIVELVEIAVQTGLIYSDEKKKKSKIKPIDKQLANPNIVVVQPANQDDQPKQSEAVKVDNEKLKTRSKIQMSLKTKLIIVFLVLIGLLVIAGVVLSLVLSLTKSASSQPKTQQKSNTSTATNNTSNTNNTVKLHTLPGDGSTIVGIGYFKSTPGYLLSVHSSITSKIKIWDLKDGGSLFNSFSTTQIAFANLFMTNEDNLVMGDLSNPNIYIYTPFGQLIKTISANTAPSQCIIQLSDEDNLFASGNVDGSIAILDFMSKSMITMLTGHKSKVYSLLQLPMNEFLASSGGDKSIIIWDWKKQTTPIEILTAENDYSPFYQVNALALLPNGNLVSGADDKWIKIWNSNSWTLKASFKADHAVKALWKLDDGNIASGDYRGNILVWDLAKGQRKTTIHSDQTYFSGGKTFPCGIAWLMQLSDGKLTSALSGGNGDIVIWQENTNSSLNTFGSLVYSWPLNSSLEDVISGANLTSLANVSFTSNTDMNNITKYAVSLSRGYLKLPSNVYFTQDFTFSIWAKFDQKEDGSSILDCGTDSKGSDSVVLAFHDYLKLEFQVNLGSNGESWGKIAASSANKPNYWYHFAITTNGLISTLYINGVVFASGKMLKPRSVIRTHCFIGKSNSEDQPQAVWASFSNMKIYSRGLSSAEVRDECNCSSASFIDKFCNTLTDLNPSYTNVDGLVNYWTFCGNYNDAVGTANGYGGSNAYLTSDRFGVALSALDLSTGYIQIPESVYFSGDYTLTAWIKIRGFGFWSRLIDFGNGPAIDNVIIGLTQDTSGQLFQVIEVSGSEVLHLTSPNVSPLNRWFHVAFVFSFPNAYIYVNGELDSSGIATDNPINVKRTQNFIGRSNWYPDNPDADAIVDELKIYNRGLNQTEVQTDINNQKYIKNVQCSPNPAYTSISGLMHYWTFCGSFDDIVGTANGYGGSNAYLTSDRFGVALSALDLSTGYIKIPPGVYFSGDYTVTAWLYIRAFNSHSRIIDVGNGKGIDNVIFDLTEGTTGQLTQAFLGSSSFFVLSSPKVSPLNTWFHVAFVLSYTNAYIYVNSELDSSGIAADSPINVTRNNCNIGRGNWYDPLNPAEYPDADAIIDELKIYNRGLSQSEVQTDMNNQKFV